MTDVFVVTEGDYEDSSPVAVYSSLVRAQGMYQVDTEWEEFGTDGDFWSASVYEPAERRDVTGQRRRYLHGVEIRRFKIDEEPS